MTRCSRRASVVVLALAAMASLAACSQAGEASDNTLITHLGTPLESFPGITEHVYTLSLTQDVRMASLPRAANQVAPSSAGWTIVGICADTPQIDPEHTKNVILRVVASGFIANSTLKSIQTGSMQDRVICGNASPTAPVLHDASTY